MFAFGLMSLGVEVWMIWSGTLVVLLAVCTFVLTLAMLFAAVLDAADNGVGQLSVFDPRAWKQFLPVAFVAVALSCYLYLTSRIPHEPTTLVRGIKDGSAVAFVASATLAFWTWRTTKSVAGGGQTEVVASAEHAEEKEREVGNERQGVVQLAEVTVRVVIEVGIEPQCHDANDDSDASNV